ncbi:MAG: CRTAC1 family protein, partial [Planctomycetales bacterium]|nr:CRTAC1 family protein [Planctomycetales bacterium]
DCSSSMENSELQRWTTCGAFVDLNSDGITDLIAANYCVTDQHPDQPCPNSEGELGTCHPLRFRAAKNRVFVGTAEGRFEDRTSVWMPSESPGRTMGLLAGTLAGQTIVDRAKNFGREVNVLMANDMSPNQFTNLDDDDGRLVETGVSRGLAVDGRNLPQASMGIAASDFDNDGDLDIFMTGFAGEHDVYYEQATNGFWVDSSVKVGVVNPTLAMVGFGTEAIDLDGDGIDEIAVTNGHIAKFPDDIYDFEQPFQLFRRGEKGTFTLVEDDSWGRYFSNDHVGRALWTIDVNADNRSDIMVTHIQEPVHLLINGTSDNNRRIGFKLVGTSCSRDAIGAVVRFEVDRKTRKLWSLSGHGYMCSNEQVLRAGVGHSEWVRNVTVEWSDGSTDRVGDLETDAQYVLVQGEPKATKVK